MSTEIHGMSSTVFPTVLWAQRKDVLFITVDVEDTEKEEISLTESKLTFKAIGGVDRKTYAVDLEFFDEVIPQESKKSRTDRHYFFILKKKKNSAYWDRLLKQSKKPHYLKTDFNKWKDEDDSGSELDDDLYGAGGGDLNAMMQQMGGMGAGPAPPDPGELGDDEEDSDDEEMPDLEKPAS